MHKPAIERIESVLDLVEEPVCDYYYNALFAAAKNADNEAERELSDDLRLLGNATSMMLRSSNPHEPFAPVMQLEGRRSAIPSDFANEELDKLASILKKIKSPECRARIADLLWLRRRHVEKARMAVIAYIESADQLLAEEYWTFADDRLSRALRLALMLGKGGNDLLTAVIARVMQCLDDPGALGSTPLPAHLLQLMIDTRCGDLTSLLNHAGLFAQAAQSGQDWHLARSYWEIVLQISARLDDQVVRRESLQNISQGYVHLARGLIAGSASALAAAHWMQCAVETYQRIPKYDRSERDSLYDELRSYQKAALKEMRKLASSSDVSEIAENARRAVSKETLFDALLSLALTISPPDYDKLRGKAEDKRAKYPLQSLFSPVHLDYEVKVVARTPAGWTETDDEAAKALWAGTLQEAEWAHSFNAQAVIDPAREQILFDHFVQMSDMYPIVTNNPVIPPGHELLWAEGLHAGLTGDFSIAAHTLVPQIENSLRYMLQKRGVVTSELKPWGLQEDQRLRSLLERDELIKALGRDSVFDLRAVLVEPTCANLRNKVAHGLASVGELYAPATVYFWWLCLRLCLLPCKIELDRSKPGSA